MIDNWYNRFRVLYLLSNGHYRSIGELFRTDDLRHFLNDDSLTEMLRRDIEYLIDGNYIKLEGDLNTGGLKIKSKGTDALSTIFEAYEQYLNEQSDPELQRQYRHISSLPDNLKGPEIYRYLKDVYGSNFKRFLRETRIFERFSQVVSTSQHGLNDLVRWTEDVLALSNQPLERKIREREDGLIERKSSFRYDRVMQGPSKKLEKETSIAISGFTNARGGILIIGVDPVGKGVGLSKDYSWVQNNNSDGFERELRNSIKKHLKDNIADILVEVRFQHFEGEEICEVIVKPSSKPIILFDGDKQEFYVRGGNSTKLYEASDMIAYCQKRFKSGHT